MGSASSIVLEPYSIDSMDAERIFSDKTQESDKPKHNTRQHSDATEELCSFDTFDESLDIENVEEPGELPPPLPARLHHGMIHARFQKRCHAGENDFLGHFETCPETEYEAEEPEGPPPPLSWRCPATLRVSLGEIAT